jgi:hypothetical protein
MKVTAANLPLTQLQPELIERRQIKRRRLDSPQSVIIQMYRSGTVLMVHYPRIAAEAQIEQRRPNAPQRGKRSCAMKRSRFHVLENRQHLPLPSAPWIALSGLVSESGAKPIAGPQLAEIFCRNTLWNKNLCHGVSRTVSANIS